MSFQILLQIMLMKRIFRKRVKDQWSNCSGTFRSVSFPYSIKKWISWLKKISPEQLVERLCPKHEQRKILSALMNEPDLYTAMLVLLAAEKLDIETGVTMKQVLDCFGIQKQ